MRIFQLAALLACLGSQALAQQPASGPARRDECFGGAASSMSSATVAYQVQLANLRSSSRNTVPANASKGELELIFRRHEAMIRELREAHDAACALPPYAFKRMPGLFGGGAAEYDRGIQPVRYRRADIPGGAAKLCRHMVPGRLPGRAGLSVNDASGRLGGWRIPPHADPATGRFRSSPVRPGPAPVVLAKRPNASASLDFELPARLEQQAVGLALVVPRIARHVGPGGPIGLTI